MAAVCPPVSAEDLNLPVIRRVMARDICFLRSPHHSAIRELGLFKAANIKVPSTRKPQRICCKVHGHHCLLHGILVHILRVSDSRLADVIHAGPFKVSDHIGETHGILPIFCQFTRLALGAADHAVGKQLVGGFVLIVQVIVSYNVPACRKRGRIARPDTFPEGAVQIDASIVHELIAVHENVLPVSGVVRIIQTAEEGAESAAHRSCGIKLPDFFRQLCGGCVTI